MIVTNTNIYQSSIASINACSLFMIFPLVQKAFELYWWKSKLLPE